jgi:endonuclease-3 related protein
VARLKGLHLLAPTALAKTEAETVRQAIRPAGHYNQKAAYVQAMATHVVAAYGGELDALLAKPTRALSTELLALRGVGPETADAILVYAAGRPRFIVDAYTRRLMGRLGAASGSEAYDEIQAMWNGVLGRRTADHAWVHGAIVEHAKRRCTLRRPTCTGCPLREVCMQRGVDAWA